MQRTETNALKNILDYLPERIRQAIEEYSKQTQLPPELVIELAIAHFLDVDSVTFDDSQIDSPGVLREQNKILKIQLAATQTKPGSAMQKNFQHLAPDEY